MRTTIRNIAFYAFGSDAFDEKVKPLGFVNDENENVLKGSYGFTTGYNKNTSPAGRYELTPTGPAEDGNYKLKYNRGTLVVTEAGEITITAASARKDYDGTERTLTEEVEISAPEGVDVYAVASGASRTNPGTEYNTINRSSVTINGLPVDDGLYKVNYVDGVLTIAPRGVTVQFGSVSSVYTGEPITATVSGSPTNAAALVDGHILIATGSRTETAVGTYTIPPSTQIMAGNEDVSHCYNIKEHPGVLIITAGGGNDGGNNAGNDGGSNNSNGGDSNFVGTTGDAGGITTALSATATIFDSAIPLGDDYVTIVDESIPLGMLPHTGGSGQKNITIDDNEIPRGAVPFSGGFGGPARLPFVLKPFETDIYPDPDKPDDGWDR